MMRRKNGSKYGIKKKTMKRKKKNNKKYCTFFVIVGFLVSLKNNMSVYKRIYPLHPKFSFKKRYFVHNIHNINK